MHKLNFNVTRMNLALDIATAKMPDDFNNVFQPIIKFMRSFGFSYDYVTALILTELVSRGTYTDDKLIELFGIGLLNTAKQIVLFNERKIESNNLDNIAKVVITCVIQHQLTRNLLGFSDCWITKNECLDLINRLG